MGAPALGGHRVQRGQSSATARLAPCHPRFAAFFCPDYYTNYYTWIRHHRGPVTVRGSERYGLREGCGCGPEEVVIAIAKADSTYSDHPERTTRSEEHTSELQSPYD